MYVYVSMCVCVVMCVCVSGWVSAFVLEPWCSGGPPLAEIRASVRRHTKVLADRERELGEPKLQLALSSSHCLLFCTMHHVSWVPRCCQIPTHAVGR